MLPDGGLILDSSACNPEYVRGTLSSLIEHVPALIFVKNAESLSFELFNNGAERFLGVPRDAMIGRSDADFFPADQAAFFAEKDCGVLNEKKVLDIPREPIDTVRGRRWLHTRKIPLLDKEGSARYLLGISLDVTERRDTKGALRRLHAELERRVASLAYRAGNASLAGSEQLADSAAGDLEVLYGTYGRAVLSHCKRLLGNTAAAEDATQEVFVRALREAGRWPAATELRHWLFRIATNYCLNELRRCRVRAQGAPELACALPSSVEDCLLARGELGRLLDGLPQRARDVALLTYVEGMPQQDVAEALGLSRRTVVNYLNQLRSRQ